jgi:hypothetical protein
MRVGRWNCPTLVGALSLWAAPAFCDGTEPIVPFWPKGAKINFIDPVDHASVSGKVSIKFAMSDIAAPGGDGGETKATNPCLLVDADLPMAFELDKALPSDAHHLLLEKGAARTIDLPPGNHTLQLIIVDENRIPHYPPVISPRISIVTKAP